MLKVDYDDRAIPEVRNKEQMPLWVDALIV
jgi:hypothetical protein